MLDVRKQRFPVVLIGHDSCDASHVFVIFGEWQDASQSPLIRSIAYLQISTSSSSVGVHWQQKPSFSRIP
eukprot:15116472-Heterocapsa_arctica.AAC.1